MTNPLPWQHAIVEREFYKLWLKDLRYYQACDLFNGRVGFKEYKLNKYARKHIKTIPL